jgi:leader peptidase (prepilin peptidase) / N-methyltransferase
MAFDLAAGLGLILILTVIAVTDWCHHIIPDVWSGALAFLGLLRAALDPAGGLREAAIGMAVALAAALVLRWVYSAIRDRQGLGLGDVKFLTAAGAWVGAFGLPFVVLIAALSGLAFAVGLHLSGRPVSAASRIAFGPHLAVGLLLTWIFKTTGLM